MKRRVRIQILAFAFALSFVGTTLAVIREEGGDPDVRPGFQGPFDEGEYIRRRDEFVALLRGIDPTRPKSRKRRTAPWHSPTGLSWDRIQFPWVKPPEAEPMSVVVFRQLKSIHLTRTLCMLARHRAAYFVRPMGAPPGQQFLTARKRSPSDV